MIRYLTLAVAACALAAAPALAADFVWTGDANFDFAAQEIDATQANYIQFFGESMGYGEGEVGPFAHSHGSNDLTWYLTGVVDGQMVTLFSQHLGTEPLDENDDGPHQEIAALGKIHFAGGTVTNIGFGCDNCSFSTFHQFDGATFTLGQDSAAPEPSSWAMMLGGFGLVGGAMRARRRTVRFA